MTALALAILAIVPYIIVTVRPNTRLMAPALLCALIFLAFTLVILLRAVLRTMEVTHDTVYGSFLMAMTWGFAYLLLVMSQPTALSIDLLRNSNHSIDWSDCMFYSFVTLTSLGGDLVPVSPQARSLTILENVSGVLYVAVLIARLISAHLRINTKTHSLEG